MKRRNNVLFCCAFLTTLVLTAPSANSGLSFNEEKTEDLQTELVSRKYNAAEKVEAATLTYDFSGIKTGSEYKTFDAATLNKLGDNANGYIVGVESNKLYFGDQSQADATGVKFGSSSVAGTLTLTFKSNIKSIKLYATKYKTYNSAFIVGGVQTLITPNQGEEPQLIEYTPTTASTSITIATSTEKVDGYTLIRAWLEKLIVDVDSGSYSADSVKSLKCSNSYSLSLNRVLRLQAFDGTKVVNGVKWSIVSGEDYATLDGSRLKAKATGTVLVQGKYGDFDPIYMTVYVGGKEDVGTFKTVKELRECFESSSSKISLTSEYENVKFATYGKIIGFDSVGGKNFYINDGKATMYVYNSLLTRDKLNLYDNVYITGTLSIYNNKPEFVLSVLRNTTNKIDGFDYFKNEVASYSEWDALTSTYANKLDSIFNFFTVDARFASYSSGTLNLYFSDNPSKLVTIAYASSFETSTALSDYTKGNDISFTAALSINKTVSQFEYVTGSKISESAHSFTGSVTSVSLTKTTANVALGKTLDVSTLVTVAGSGDYNPNVKYALDAATYGSITSEGVLTVGSTSTFVGKTIVVTVSSLADATKSATLTVTITENLKSSTITSTGLALTGSYADNATGKSFAISDDTHTITVCYYQVSDYGDGIQMRYKYSKQSSIYNLTAAPYSISSVTLYATSGKSLEYSTSVDVLGGTSAFSSTAATTTKATTTAADGAASATYTFASTDNFTFFKVQHIAGGKVLYFSSIEVTYRK